MITKPSILIFTDWYEPGFKAGGPIRSCSNFAAQMKEGFSVFVFTGNMDAGERVPYSGVESDAWVERSGVHVFYASAAKLKWQAIAKLVNTLQPDFIYLNSMYSLYFTIYPLLMKRLSKIRGKIVLAPRGMLQEGAMRFKPFKKKLFLSAIRLLRMERDIYMHATDAQEEKDILRYLPRVRSVHIIPNFSAAIESVITWPEKVPGSLKLVFISRISPKKNLLFLLKLLQGIQTATITLAIRGTIEDEGYWHQCKKAIDSNLSNIRVDFQGPIDNKEVASFLSDHHLFILPTLGENFGHAIFEALGAGRPVLISDRTPWRNLETEKAGWDIPLNDPGRFVAIIERVAEMDREEYLEWCKRSHAYAQKKSNNADLREKYKALFE